MNYIGSKLSLKNFIVETILKVTKNFNGKIFADLFAGTGVIGTEFKKIGYQVISNDIQHYSYVLNKHYIENNNPIDTALFEYLNSLEGIEGFIYNNYSLGSGSGRNYFTDYNSKKCDAIRIEIENLYEKKIIDIHQYYYFLASLINSIDKFANTASVYGAFLKKIKRSAEKNFTLELLPIIDGNNNGKVYNENISMLINKIEGDILYLDPPYNSRQYATNYHLLETISKYDYPKISGKTGLRNYSEQKSEFCSKRTVEQAFDNLLKNARFKYIFLSYNDEGLMDLDTIKKIMEKYGKYEFYTTDYRRFKADTDENRNHKKIGTVEYLHCLIKTKEE